VKTGRVTTEILVAVASSMCAMIKRGTRNAQSLKTIVTSLYRFDKRLVSFESLTPLIRIQISEHRNSCLCYQQIQSTQTEHINSIRCFCIFYYMFRPQTFSPSTGR